MKKHPEADYLHQQNPNLHNSEEVEAVSAYLRASGMHIPNSPDAKIAGYLDFLTEVVNDGVLTGDQASVERQIEAHVIRADDVPESYFELQRRIAREQGHGDIHISDDMRRQLIEALQADQRAGLAKWVEYLGGEDGGYPDWFKYYTWNSVVKLGAFDKEKGEFQKRSKSTAAAYPELNREALAYVFDKLSRHRVQGLSPENEDEKLKELLKISNFGKLYAYAVLETTPDGPELLADTAGSWIKFNQTSDPRTARRLSESLQGHGTGWCTAGETTASMQLGGGDFYVYYTRDEKGKDTVPRVAIRMQRGQVAEVRGIEAQQELENVMLDIASEKLHELPGGGEYIQKAEDMKRLTELESRINEGVSLTYDDYRFLYEINRQITGFGYGEDPRVKELRSMLDSQKVFNELATVSYEDAIKGLHGMRNLDSALLLKLNDLGFDEVWRYLDSFMCTHPNQTAKQLIAQGRERELIHMLKIMENLDGEIAESLLDEGSAYMITDYLDSFKYFTEATVAALISSAKREKETGLSHRVTSALEVQLVSHPVKFRSHKERAATLGSLIELDALGDYDPMRYVGLVNMLPDLEGTFLSGHNYGYDLLGIISTYLKHKLPKGDNGTIQTSEVSEAAKDMLAKYGLRPYDEVKIRIDPLKVKPFPQDYLWTSKEGRWEFILGLLK